MDKDMISEFGYFIVAAIVALILLTSITGTTILNNVKSTIDESVPDHEAQEYLNDDEFALYLYEQSLTPPESE